MNKITNWEIKKTNRNNIFTAIYEARQISKQQLSETLGLSMPTITQNLKELEALNLIKKEGVFDSNASCGRKARIISCNPTSRISVGVEILKEKVYAAAIDLYGTVLKEDTFLFPFQNSSLYFCALGNWINCFIAELALPAESILGAAITIQGLVSMDHSQIIYGKLMDCTGLALTELSQHIKWPCLFFHDSQAAAFAETWLDPELTDALFLWLNPNFGAALIINGTIHQGVGGLGNTMEHMRLVPGGKNCYCGQQGCVEAYCSADALRAQAHQDIPAFFDALRKGSPSRRKIWQEYLSYLALSIHNVLMIFDCDVVFSGMLSPYLQQEDLDIISKELKSRSAFSFYEPRLRMGASNQYAAAVGAAVYQIADFFQHGDVFQ